MDCRRVSALELLLVSGGVMLMLLLLLVHGPAPVAAWGADGHHMTCHIAEVGLLCFGFVGLDSTSHLHSRAD